MHDDAIDALHDLVAFAEEIFELASGRDTERDEIERMRYLAVERLLELVGESLNRAIRVEPALKKDFTQTRQVVGMRNRLAHEYDSVDPEILWDTALNDIPTVIVEIRQILDATVAEERA